MDKQCRVLIPIVLRSSAHMKGDVDILVYPNYLEVWNHAQFLKNLKSNPITAQDEKMLNQLSSAPRSPWAIQRNKEKGHIHGGERRFGIHRRVRSDSRGHAIRGAQTDSKWRAGVVLTQ
jgi:putative antitoxin-like MraZ protein